MSKLNVTSLPIIEKDVADLETLEAELAMANKRVAQAIRRRDEVIERMIIPVRERAIRDLKRRGIVLGETRVIVSQRSWLNDEWEYKEVFVMDVIVEEGWGGADEAFDLHQMTPRIEYEFALVKKDGKPSRAPTGIHGGATIERIAV
ncbi:MULTISPECIES: hypothetical protein [unclassified Marinovum]|uniref:hypothetical protein n=1 Tax=unclassified Marinovum TaxID=2647166 RepID=UPI003EDBEBB6